METIALGVVETIARRVVKTGAADARLVDFRSHSTYPYVTSRRSHFSVTGYSTVDAGDSRGQSQRRQRSRPSFDGLAAQLATCETPQVIAISASNDIVATDPGAEHDATGQSLEAPHGDGAAAGISARADLKRQPDKP